MIITIVAQVITVATIVIDHATQAMSVVCPNVMILPSAHIHNQDALLHMEVLMIVSGIVTMIYAWLEYKHLICY